MQPHNARVPRAQSHQSVLLRESSLLFLVSFEMGFVYSLDSVLLARSKEFAQPDLQARYGTRNDSGPALLTVEYDPCPSSSLNSKSSTVILPLTELLRDLECARDAGGRSTACSSSG